MVRLRQVDKLPRASKDHRYPEAQFLDGNLFLYIKDRNHQTKKEVKGNQLRFFDQVVLDRKG